MADERKNRLAETLDQIIFIIKRYIGWVLSGLAIIFIGGTIYAISAPPNWLWADGEKHKNIELLRNLTFALGGLAALYGLVIAARRQEKFEEQVKISQRQTETAQTQLFNERLGRGIEQLANTDIALRVAGIRILDNLAKTATEEDIELIVDIIHTYLHTKAKINRDEDGNIIPNTRDKNENRDDIAYAVKTVFKYRELPEPWIHGDIGFSELDLRELNLSDTSLIEANLCRTILTGANLSLTNLGEANLSNADLKGAYLWETNLSCANLSNANLTGANLTITNLIAANLLNANLTGADLSSANLTKADLSDADLKGATLWDTNLTEADLSDANLTGAELSDANLKNVRELTQTQFDQIIYYKNSHPENIPNHLTLPTDRAYTDDQDGKRIFITSNRDWSEQDVDKYIAKLIADAKKSKKTKK